MDDEPRLRAEDSALGEALRDAQNVGPSDTERAAMVAGLAGVFGPPPGGLPSGPEAATSGATGSSGALGGSALVKWAAAACLVGGAVWWALPDAPTPDAVATVMIPADAEAEATPEVRPPPTTGAIMPTAEVLEFLPQHAEPLGAEPVALAIQEESTPRPARPTRGEQAQQAAAMRSGSSASSVMSSSAASSSGTSSSAMSAVPSVEPQPSEEPTRPPSELGLLAEARSVLRSSPAQTLRLTDEHRAQFGGGALVEEREVLAIEALIRLGRRPQAASRAERFHHRYPRSIHAGRIAAVLAP